MSEAVADSHLRIADALRTIHGLQEEVLKVESLEVFRRRARLRKNKLQFLTRGLTKFGIRLGADADPVECGRRNERAVGLDGGEKSSRAHGIDELRVELQQRFAAGEDDETPFESMPPRRCNGVSKRRRGRKTAPAVAAGADEIGVAEPADRRGTILFAAAPQITSGKTAEDGGAPGVGAFALQRPEYFFDDETQASVP